MNAHRWEAEYEARRRASSQAKAPKAWALHDRCIEATLGVLTEEQETALVGLMSVLDWYRANAVEINGDQERQVAQAIDAAVGEASRG